MGTATYREKVSKGSRKDKGKWRETKQPASDSNPRRLHANPPNPGEKLID